MKKRVLAAMCSFSILLSGCSLPFVGTKQEAATEASSEASSVEAVEEVSVEASTEATSEDETETTDEIDFAANKPVFKIVERNDSYYAYPDGNIKLAGEYKLQSLMLFDEYKELYPELDKVLTAKTDELIEKFNNEDEKFIEDVKEKSDSAIQDGNSIKNYWVKHELVLQRTNDRYLGFYEMVQDNWNTSYLYERNGYTYDIVTGEELKLGDVLNISEEDLNKIICDSLRENYPEDADELEGAEDALKDYKYDAEGENAYNWYLSYDGVHFFFNENTLVKGKIFGSHEVVIPFDEGFVNDEYVFDTSKGYCYMIDDIYPMTMDRYDGHDSYYELYMTEDGENSGYASALSLSYKDQLATIEEYYEIDSFMYKYDVATSDGREFFYIAIQGMDYDYELFIFEVTGGNLKAVGTDYFSFTDAGSETNSDYAGEAVLTDPDAMVFGLHSDLFGTLSCYGKYKVGSDGHPEFTGDYYTICWICGDEDITTKAEVGAVVVLEDGTTQEEITIPVGTIVVPVRTDGETFTDCRLEDGSMARFYYTSTTYPATIDGEAMEDLFDNLCYAG